VLPDLRWVLLSWASDGNVVFMEWECTATLGGRLLTWRGVDKMTLREGRIEEEIVYSDTLPLWQVLDSSMNRGPLVDASLLEQKAADVEGATS